MIDAVDVREKCAYIDAEEELRRNGQKIGFKGAETHLTENVGEIVLRRAGRDVVGQANLMNVSGSASEVVGMPYEVERPQVVVLNAFPEALQIDTLPVVHITL